MEPQMSCAAPSLRRALRADAPRRPKSLQAILSTEHSMEEPPVRRLALAEHPQVRAAVIDRDVVVAPDVPAIPPTGFDPLRIAEQPQRSPAPRQPGALVELPRHGQQP